MKLEELRKKLSTPREPEPKPEHVHPNSGKFEFNVNGKLEFSLGGKPFPKSPLAELPLKKKPSEAGIAMPIIRGGDATGSRTKGFFEVRGGDAHPSSRTKALGALGEEALVGIAAATGTNPEYVRKTLDDLFEIEKSRKREILLKRRR